MAGKVGQKKGEHMDDARIIKRNVAFGGISDKAIKQYQDDNNIKYASSAVWKLTMWALEKLGYM